MSGCYSTCYRGRPNKWERPAIRADEREEEKDLAMGSYSDAKDELEELIKQVR